MRWRIDRFEFHLKTEMRDEQKSTLNSFIQFFVFSIRSFILFCVCVCDCKETRSLCLYRAVVFLEGRESFLYACYTLNRPYLHPTIEKQTNPIRFYLRLYKIQAWNRFWA